MAGKFGFAELISLAITARNLRDDSIYLLSKKLLSNANGISNVTIIQIKNDLQSIFPENEVKNPKPKTQNPKETRKIRNDVKEK